MPGSKYVVMLVLVTGLFMLTLRAAAEAPGPAEEKSVEILLEKLARSEAAVRELSRTLERQDQTLEALADRLAELETRRSEASPSRTGIAPSSPPTQTTAPAALPAPPLPDRAAARRPAAPRPIEPGQLEVDEEASERALDRTLVIGGALLLPYGQAEIQTGLRYVRNGQSAAFFDASGFVFASELRRDLVDFDTALRIGLPFDAQLELGLPIRYAREKETFKIGFVEADEDERSGLGVGDLRLGVAKTLLREARWWPDVVGRITWDSDSGKFKDGGVVLGGFGFHELEGGLTFVKRQDPLAFVGTISYQTAFQNRNIDPGDRVRVSAAAILAASPETSLRFGLENTFLDDLEFDGETVDGSDRMIGLLTLGASSIVGRGKLLDLSVGIGATDEAPDYTVRLSFSWRFNLPGQLAAR